MIFYFAQSSNPPQNHRIRQSRQANRTEVMSNAEVKL